MAVHYTCDICGKEFKNRNNHPTEVSAKKRISDAVKVAMNGFGSADVCDSCHITVIEAIRDLRKAGK